MRVRPDGGFTAVELGVTIVLIGLVVAFGIGHVDTTAWKLDAAGHQVEQRLRAARALAVLRQHDVVVSFDTEGRVITVHEDRNSDGVIDAGERVTNRTLEGRAVFDRASAPPFAGFVDGAVTFPAMSVTFERNGSASQEGAVYVGWPGVEKMRVVVVSRATGYAEMYRYNGSDWSSE